MSASSAQTLRDPSRPVRPRPLAPRVGWFRLGFALALGLLTTVGVAWGLAAVERPMSVFADPGAGRLGDGVPCWRVRTWAFVGYTTQTCSPIYNEGEARAERAYPGTIQSWSMAAAPPTDATIAPGADRSYQWFSESAAGWPMRAFKGTTRYDGRANRSVSPNYAIEAHGQWSVTLGGHDYTLPVQPIWAGLIGNTLLAGAGWWVLMLIPGRLRRWRRRRAGRCEQCGYGREGLAAGAVCPECGAVNPP